MGRLYYYTEPLALHNIMKHDSGTLLRLFHYTCPFPKLQELPMVLPFQASEICLPFDVVYNLIDVLDPLEKSDRDLLKSLSLCCRSFIPATQKKIFYFIRLDGPRAKGPSTAASRMLMRKEHFSHLSQILDTSPHIASYIRSVMWNIFKSDHPSALESVFSRLDSVRELHFRSCNRSILEPDIDWRSFIIAHEAYSFHKMVVGLLRNPCLVHLCVWDVGNFPTEPFLRRSDQLSVKEPRQWCITVVAGEKTSGNCDGSGPQRLPRVLHYTLGTYCARWPRRFGVLSGDSRTQSDIVDVPKHPFDIGTVSNLIATVSSRQAVEQLGICLESVRELESLRVYRACSFHCLLPATLNSPLVCDSPFLGGLATNVLSTPMRTLKRLDLVFYPSLQCPFGYIGVSKELEVIAHHNVLEELTLTFHLMAKDNDTMLMFGQELSRILKTLGGNSFPCLRSLNIALFICMPLYIFGFFTEEDIDYDVFEGLKGCLDHMKGLDGIDWSLVVKAISWVENAFRYTCPQINV
ncbi:hypothetical protein CVT26_016196 [Gymnopilus dilepis]|uniref:F-box domain-containing protein n=1 Tax=Gymnopilus dilepis TaxID=231916 RepID=A0A409XYX5_9AGAR|nr:hypothetical protein CVT26_016196 [Gymnopilus dilepis]